MTHIAGQNKPHTPYLSLDLSTVTTAYSAMRKAMPDVTIHYAIKCNPDVQLARHLAQLGCSFEIASTTEMNILREAGVEPKALLFTNPVKMSAHIRTAHEAGVWRFSFDSSAELQKIAADAPGAAVFVRIKAPDYNSAVPSEGKFGVDIHTAADLMQGAVKLNLKPYGISFHVGSQMESPVPWDVAIEEAAKLMRLLQERDITIEMLDIGGGFPGFYGKTLPHISEYGEFINQSLAKHLPYKVNLAAEPGRYLVANAGTMITTIIGVAQRGSKTWLHLDVGAFNGMMEALETQNTLRFPVSDSRENKQKQRYNLTGPSCDSQDSILFDVELSAELKVGDRIFIHTAGAYTTCYASTFNGFEIPKSYLASLDS